MGEPSEDAEFPVRLESEDAKRGGNDVPLSLVVRSRNSLIGAVALHRVLSAGQLVGQHPANRLVKNSDEEDQWENFLVSHFCKRSNIVATLLWIVDCNDGNSHAI